MNKVEYKFPDKTVTYYFDAEFSFLEQIVSKQQTILITDKNVFEKNIARFSEWKTIVIQSGEEFKQQAVVDDIIQQLIAMEADRTTFIIGIGGGVVTDIAGYAAGIYMRGLKFAFIPTTILAMVDAAIGGKNGVDVGEYKNLVGLIRQPEFILFDYSLLKTLSASQWVNGFAEIVKHACIKDSLLFALLENEEIENFHSDKNKLAALIERNVHIKTRVVVEDEFEKGDRKLLNFGHTLGHAIENIYQLPHGHAVSIGIVAACTISEKVNNFSPAEKQRVIRVLEKYHLPTSIVFDRQKIWSLLKMDKKRVSNEMNFVLLNSIGSAKVTAIPLDHLQEMINNIL